LISDSISSHILIIPLHLDNKMHPAKAEQTVPTVLAYHIYSTNFSDLPYIYYQIPKFTKNAGAQCDLKGPIVI